MTGNNQLDYVFASTGFHEGITVRALNSAEEWGASDRCRLLIKVADEVIPSPDPSDAVVPPPSSLQDVVDDQTT